MIASNEQGNTVTRIQEVGVSARAPSIVNFSSDRTKIRAGESIRLQWETADAERVVLYDTKNNVDRQLDRTGHLDYRPRVTTALQLRAYNEEDEATRSVVTIEVLGDPKVVSFKAEQQTISKGAKTRLVWRTENSDRVVLVLDGRQITVRDQGDYFVSPDTDTSYKLIAYGGEKSATKATKVSVKPLWVATPLPPTITADAARTLSAAASDAALQARVAQLSTASRGSISLKQTYTADLDSGRTSAGANSDLWFNAETATKRYLTPRNGARLRLMGTTEPGKNGCAQASLGAAGITISHLTRGQYVCVKTNRGAYSQLVVTAASGASPGTLKFNYETWN